MRTCAPREGLGLVQASTTALTPSSEVPPQISYDSPSTSDGAGGETAGKGRSYDPFGDYSTGSRMPYHDKTEGGGTAEGEEEEDDGKDWLDVLREEEEKKSGLGLTSMPTAAEEGKGV
jgi:hypothetical protein